MGGGIYKTTISGDVEQVFDNFTAANGTSQHPLVQVGSSEGANDSFRIAISGSGTTIAANQYYDDGTTLYVHLNSECGPHLRGDQREQPKSDHRGLRR